MILCVRIMNKHWYIAYKARRIFSGGDKGVHGGGLKILDRGESLPYPPPYLTSLIVKYSKTRIKRYNDIVKYSKTRIQRCYNIVKYFKARIKKYNNISESSKTRKQRYNDTVKYSKTRI